MFKVIDCEQRSDEWVKVKLGKPSGSIADRFITQTGKPSTSADEAISRLVAELILGEPDETFQSEDMARGKELEEEALRYLNFTHGYSFRPCGFIQSEEYDYGISPDAMDFENETGLEMKIPRVHTHIEYLAGGVLPKKYKAQVQMALLVTGFKKWVFLSYHPELKPFVVTVERDEEYIKTLQEILIKSCTEIQERLKRVTQILEEEAV
jgi:hypothetical protein